MRMQEVKKAQKKYEQQLLSLPNVLSVGRGKKFIKGIRTDRNAIIVLVEKKVPRSRLAPEYLIPRELGGAETDVIESARIDAPPPGLLEAEEDPTKRHRPAPPGVSVGHEGVTAGTLGCWVIDNKTGNLVMLSNNHVLANSNKGEPGDSVFQPGPYDGGTPASNDIAWLSNILMLEFMPTQCSITSAVCKALNALLALLGRKGRVQVQMAPQFALNVADCALALPRKEEDVKLEILEIGKPSTEIREAEAGLKVKKYGRTTRYTTGEVIAIDATTQVNYGGPIAMFEHQIIAGPISAGGDSGSLVLDMNNHPVGLLFAGSEKVTILSPIQVVMDALDISLVE